MRLYDYQDWCRHCRAALADQAFEYVCTVCRERVAALARTLIGNLVIAGALARERNLVVAACVTELHSYRRHAGRQADIYIAADALAGGAWQRTLPRTIPLYHWRDTVNPRRDCTCHRSDSAFHFCPVHRRSP